jgi:5'-deoxynucleotidase YfbR-like HD superfamily hydrolase
MDKLIPSKLGKLKIICSLPLFSDSICIKRQSAAEHGYTQIILSMILAPYLDLSTTEQCELIELSIFAELPKTLLGDPSYHLRQNHPEVKEIYDTIRGKIWKETELSLGIETTRSATLFGLHELIDSFASMLYIEKECLLGNQFFAAERHKTFYDIKRKQALTNIDLSKLHPCSLSDSQSSYKKTSVTKFNWKDAITLLDQIFDEANRGRLENGISGYSSTFLGMVEKLKEHYRYKGWSYHFPESVGEHTFQVVFLCRLLATKLNLPENLRVQLYHAAALHDLAEAYASDVIYPIKLREKEVEKIHRNIEKSIIQNICQRFRLSWPTDPHILAIVDICDRFSSQIYFDRETRSGNTHFNVPNSSMEVVRDFYQKDYPEIFQELDNLWLEYVSSL